MHCIYLHRIDFTFNRIRCLCVYACIHTTTTSLDIYTAFLYVTQSRLYGRKWNWLLAPLSGNLQAQIVLVFFFVFFFWDQLVSFVFLHVAQHISLCCPSSVSRGPKEPNVFRGLLSSATCQRCSSHLHTMQINFLHIWEFKSNYFLVVYYIAFDILVVETKHCNFLAKEHCKYGHFQ